MERKKKGRRLVELGKDLAILVLALSALYLLGRTQFYTLGGEGWLSGIAALLPGGEEPVADRPEGGWGQGGILRPVRMVLATPLASYGIQYDGEQVGETFGELLNPLSDVLEGAQAPHKTTVRAWRAALAGEVPTVYLDFLGPVPLADLAAWLSGGRAPNQNLTGTARHVALSLEEDGNVTLSYINEPDGMYYACETTADVAGRLEELLTDLPLNNVSFAFEDPAQYGALAPYTLLGQRAPEPRKYSVQDPIPLAAAAAETAALEGAADTLVRSLSFHPQSYTAYPTTGGVAIQEGGDRLTVGSSGTVTYRASGEEDPRYPISGGDEPAQWQIVDGAWAFAEKTVGPLCGDARLYLSGIETLADGATAVVFSYQLNGAAVRVGSEGYAARIVVRGGAISEFTLQLRNYTDTGETTLVMQAVRAMAAMGALDAEGSELQLCYLDRGGDTVTAGWIAQ